MKKAIFFGIFLILAVCVAHFYSLGLIRSSIEKSVANLDKNENIEVLSFSKKEGLFNTSSELIASVHGAELNVTSNISHFFGFVRGSGSIRAANAPAKTLAQIFLGGREKIDFKVVGDELSFDLPYLELDDEGSKYTLRDSKVFVSFVAGNKISADISTASIKDYAYNADFKGLKASFKENEQKAELSFDELSFSSFALSFGAKNARINTDFSKQPFLASGDIAGLDIFDTSFSDISFLGHSSDFEGESLSLDNFSLKSAKAESLSLSAKAQKNEWAEYELSGELNATAKPSQILGSLGEIIVPYEDKILRQNEKGFSLSFKSQNNDIIFNESVSLSALIANEFFNMLLN